MKSIYPSKSFIEKFKKADTDALLTCGRRSNPRRLTLEKEQNKQPMTPDQLDDLITDQAKQQATKNVCNYSPYSYSAGFEDGARWMKEMLEKN